jgi:hypothetical protein
MINFVEHKVTMEPEGLMEFIRSPVDFVEPPEGSENDGR